MTDYKEKYEELLDSHKRLKEELDSIKSNAEDYNDPDLKNGGNTEVQPVDLRRRIFEEFAEMLPQMVYEVDITGRIIYSNSQGLSFFGYNKEDIESGIHISRLFPDSYGRMIVNLKGLKSPEQISSNEYNARRKDGTYVPILTHSFALFHQGRITGYRGVVTDISKHKEYEDQISREKAFLEHLIDSIPEAIAIIDRQGDITSINKEFTNLFGYTVREVIGKKVDDLIVPEEMINEAISIDTITTERRKDHKADYKKRQVRPQDPGFPYCYQHHNQQRNCCIPWNLQGYLNGEEKPAYSGDPVQHLDCRP